MIWRVVWRVTAQNVMMTLEYRWAFLIYMINVIVGPLISLLVWLTVSEQGVPLPYNRSQFVTYYVLLSVVSMLTGTWGAEYIGRSIRLGTLSPWLLRPVPYITQFVANNIGEKVIKLPLLLPLVLLVSAFFRNDLRLPTAPLAWMQFLVALVLAAVIAFLINFIIGSLAFWIEDISGFIRVTVLVGAFLAGQLVPLALFPANLAPLLEIQPFRYTISFPLEVLTGALSGAALARGFAWQIGYCLGFWACYRLLWHYGLRAYTASGA